MTVMYDEGKPSLEDIQHHGVKGMKWGKRKKFSTADVHNARERVRLADKKATTTKAEEKVNNSKDAAIAMRLTRGEKAAAILLAGPIGLAVIGINSRATKKAEKNSGLRERR